MCCTGTDYPLCNFIMIIDDAKNYQTGDFILKTQVKKPLQLIPRLGKFT